MRHFFLLLFLFGMGNTLSAQVNSFGHLSDYLEKRQDFSKAKISTFDHLERYINTRHINHHKFRSNATHKLDSAVIFEWSDLAEELIPSRKEEYVYNPEGNVIEIRNYHLMNSAWLPLYREILAYDNQGRVTEITQYEWSGQGNQWVPDYRDIITYTSTGGFQEIISYWRSGGQWVPDYKTEFTYLAPEIINEIIEYEWDDSDDIWIAEYKIVFDYSVTNTTNLTDYWWDDFTGQWMPEWRWEIEEDNRGNTIRQSFFDWDEIENDWVEDTRIESFYDSNDNFIEEIVFDLNFEDELEPFTRKLLSYNDINFLISDTTYIWDDFEEEWVSFIFTSYEYDDFGNPTSEAEHIEFIFDWEVFQEKTMTYNQNIPLDNIFLPYTNEQGFFESELFFWDFFLPTEQTHLVVSQPLGYTIAELLLGPDFISEEGVYYYSETGTTGITEIDADALTVYPNPVGDQISVIGENLESATFTLFDLQGRLVLTRVLNQGDPIFVGDLNPGMFLYRIEGNGLVHNGKLVKQ